MRRRVWLVVGHLQKNVPASGTRWRYSVPHVLMDACVCACTRLLRYLVVTLRNIVVLPVLLSRMVSALTIGTAALHLR